MYKTPEFRPIKPTQNANANPQLTNTIYNNQISDESSDDSDPSLNDSYEAEHARDKNDGQNARACNCSEFEHILINGFIRMEKGIQIVCFHHQYELSPFMEIDLEFLDMQYSMMYDHDMVNTKMHVKELNDLTMWPLTHLPVDKDHSKKGKFQMQADNSDHDQKKLHNAKR